jgi:hypothetical protein
LLQFPAPWSQKKSDRPLSHTKNSSDRKWHQRRVRQRGQFDEQTVTSESREQTGATACASTVFPIPPGPVMVTIR